MKKLYILLIVICIMFIGCGRKESRYLKDNFVFVEGGNLKIDENYKNYFKDGDTNVKLTYDFYIAKYEVTQKEWRDVTGEDYYVKGENKEEEKILNKDLIKNDKYPIRLITWYKAIEFCNRLSKKEGIPIAYDNAGNLLDEEGKKTSDITKVRGYRLPTRAEWEYAARGGKRSKGYKYIGSNDLNEVAWNIDNSDDKIHEVGLKKPNELGIYDMNGNVSEMCTDYFNAKLSNLNPIGLISISMDTSRIIKGGGYLFYSDDGEKIMPEYEIGVNSWIEEKDKAIQEGPGIEYNYQMGDADDYVGFRIAKTVN